MLDQDLRVECWPPPQPQGGQHVGTDLKLFGDDALGDGLPRMASSATLNSALWFFRFVLLICALPV